MLQAHPHAIHFKHILYFGEGHPSNLIVFGSDVIEAVVGTSIYKCHPGPLL
jgi:hypothetical protein